MTTHKIWRYERELYIGVGPLIYVRTAFDVPDIAGGVCPAFYHVAGRLTRINRARYEGWHPGHALFIVAPVGETPPDKLLRLPISEDDLR